MSTCSSPGGPGTVVASKIHSAPLDRADLRTNTEKASIATFPTVDKAHGRASKPRAPVAIFPRGRKHRARSWEADVIRINWQVCRDQHDRSDGEKKSSHHVNQPRRTRVCMRGSPPHMEKAPREGATAKKSYRDLEGKTVGLNSPHSAVTPPGSRGETTSDAEDARGQTPGKRHGAEAKEREAPRPSFIYPEGALAPAH